MRILINFVWYTILAGIVIAFCVLNQQIVPVDLYGLKILAPMHFWLILSFFLGVTVETLRACCVRVMRYVFGHPR